MISFFNTSLSLLTVLAQLGLAAGIFLHLFTRSWAEKQPGHAWVKRHAIVLAGIVAAVATAGSLFYSEVAGYVPCKLCWFQRIFMYPQVILFAIAWWKKENHIWRYALALSILGGIIALYHYYLQLGGNPLIPCSTVGYSVNCSQRFVMEYGYITIPLMSLTAFASIIFLMLHANKETPDPTLPNRG